MKELGEAKKILSMEIIKDRSLGSLMYLMVRTRPDIAYAGTINVGLVYGTNRGNHVDVTGFVDSDYAKESNKEAEYMALTEAVKEAIWLKGLLEEWGVNLSGCRVSEIYRVESRSNLHIFFTNNPPIPSCRTTVSMPISECLPTQRLDPGMDTLVEVHVDHS
nr:hypothetical protein [Tanacetum cinerariifolium]